MRTMHVLSVVSFLVFGLAATGCAKKSGGGAGSGKRGAAGLVGTWSVDGEATVAGSQEFDTATSEQKKQIVQMLSKAEMKIEKDTITITGLDEDERNSYDVLKDKGDRVTIKTVNPKGKREKVWIRYVSDDEIHAKSSKMVFVLKRKK